ncbi:Porphobilinogen deaminase,porphobilinogen deaminase,Uroporphyrinogen-III synthase,porphobilinogen deaminase,Porphobilinogen deaminase, dipyromethane cofactor binding domain [Chlamydia serpentis]|uniref:hydroxymethylbilane synthase n=1 Tax=Chlamydia serpentis TaxID=1967782 RepID=A0A2R8F9X5_9CHLA|nr:hydroxymethylbilane synthase [Chlamydia serpentis]SPN73223.1 Porphobilinogen deaminase,porphobilinogen deaminase,Uroporphyrinogen-III synthase,porphobilinogen deaminase,Porphobilinogen deaminase, dipyromethane cofactor binding domain [Chlamydia serpentis]
MLSACYADPFLTDFCQGKRPLRIASRNSNLAKIQAYECMSLLRSWYPKVWFRLYTIKTTGDRNKKTPLRLVENTHFFTDSVDALVKNKICHFAIHSAKDLSDTPSLPIVAITQSLDPTDLLVYADRYIDEPLPPRPRLGSSSLRRNKILKQLFPQGKILDIRGTIEERLNQLHSGYYEAIVLAKAASLRLRLHHLYSIELPPPYHPLQGSLAITATDPIDAWRKFFHPITAFVDDSSSQLNQLQEAIS